MTDLAARSVRIFPGHATTKTSADGAPANPDAFYWEPVDYAGDVLFSEAFATSDEAVAEARAYVDGGVQ